MSASSSNHDSSNHNDSSSSSSSSQFLPRDFFYAHYNLTEIRRLRYQNSIDANVTPRHVDMVWSDIVRLFPSKSHAESSTSPSKSIVVGGIVDEESQVLTCPDDLKNVLKMDYEKLQDFNEELFLTLRRCLARQVAIEDEYQDHPDAELQPIMFSNDGTMLDGYSIGIVREASPASHPIPDDDYLAAYGTRIDKLDHCVCILKRSHKDDNVNNNNNETWQVMECLSALELRLSTDNGDCQAFTPGEEVYRYIDIGFNHEAIAQVMYYAMEWVLPSYSKIGQLNGEIPWAIVVGNRMPLRRSSRKKNQPPSTATNRWVTGKIYVPEQCGCFFHYAVTGFRVIDASEDESISDESLNAALSVYLDTIYAGLSAARNWLESLHKGKPFQSVPTSGMKIMIGKTELTNLKLRGRAGKLGPPEYQNRSDPDEWIINQGEIFTGKLNIHQLTTGGDWNVAEFVRLSDLDEDVDVVVKVASAAVHNYFTKPYHACATLQQIYHNFEAIENAKSRLESLADWVRLLQPHPNADAAAFDMDATVQEQIAKRIEGKKEELAKEEQKLAKLTAQAPEIGDVLLAFCGYSVGMITIMADLTKQNYTALFPFTFKDNLPILWKAFLELVEHVLLPLAEFRAIHPDLRPGYNETANILCQTTEQDGSLQVTLKIIDFESLVCDYYWRSPEGCLRIRNEGTNKKFLWWQCFAMAFAWKHKRSQSEMIKVDLEKEFSSWHEQRDLASGQAHSDSWMELFNSFDEKEMTCDLLPILAQVFPMN